MLPGATDIPPIVLAVVVPFLLLLLLTPRYSKFLTSRNMIARDVHKKDGRMVPTPAGPILMAALLIGEVVVFIFYGSIVPVVLSAVILIAGLIGLLDDLKPLSGSVKPTLLILAAVPILLGGRVFPGLYNPKLYFPLFASTGTHFIIYAILILASIPVLSNAFNMMDAFNGEISSFTLITSLALLFAMTLRAYALHDYSVIRIAMTLPLVAVSLGFLIFNRYPSRIFDGDSGSLSFGAMYAALAFLGGVEFAALIAVIPAILNAFYILSSVKGLVEHKRIAVRPTFLREDGTLQANNEPGAPTTLARLLLLDGPLSEKELVTKMIFLTVFSGLLSALTSLLTWVV